MLNTTPQRSIRFKVFCRRWLSTSGRQNRSGDKQSGTGNLMALTNDAPKTGICPVYLVSQSIIPDARLFNQCPPKRKKGQIFERIFPAPEIKVEFAAPQAIVFPCVGS
jgi:hypothetical protein